MSADLYIHIKTEEITDQVLRIFFSNNLGSKYFNMRANYSHEAYDRASDLIEEAPSIEVGEVSWLKAALFEDGETYIPAPVEAVHKIIGEDLPVIDDDFIARVAVALGLENRTGYSLGDSDEIIEFLTEHKGERCFTISW